MIIKSERFEAEKYHALVESTSDLIWIVDPEDFGLLSFNTAFYNYFVYGRGIVPEVGMVPARLVPIDRVDTWRSFYQKAIDDGPYTTLYEAVPKNYYLNLSICPLRISGELVGVSVFGKDVSEVIIYRKMMEETNRRLEARLQKSINVISKIGELRDIYTSGHQRKVQQLACALGKEMGLSESTITEISHAALIHDIGKMFVASDILNKPGKLTNLEFEIIKTHVEYGYEVALEIDFPNEVPKIIHQHHERLDGSGYPGRLVGDEIIMESRILAVADVVEAISSHRPYRPSLGIDEAMAEILKNKGILYDSKVVDACVGLFLGKSFEFEA